MIVPLLILWLGYGEREATGTSLAAITVIAAIAATLQALYGNGRFLDGLMLGVPAVAGVLVGTALQQRVPAYAVSAVFVVVLVVSAAVLIL